MRKISESSEDKAFNIGCITFFLGDIILIAGLSTMMDLAFAFILTIILTPITLAVFFLFGKGLSLLIDTDKYEPEIKRKAYKPRKIKVEKIVEETPAHSNSYSYRKEPEILDYECSWCGKSISRSDYNIYHEKCYHCFDMLDSSDD